MIKTKRIGWMLIGLAVTLVLILAACGPAVTESTSPLDTPSVGEPAGQGPTIPSGAEEVTSLVQQDLAERLGIAQDEIRIVEVKAVEWPDASLGCPQPGKMYAQVITPGYEIVLSAGGREYAYHTGGNNLILCENGEPSMGKSEETSETLTPQETALVGQAKADLRSRLKQAQAAITVQTIDPVRWPDSSLGCPQPDMNYLTVVTPGYLIELEAEGRTYEYHASQDQVVYCDNPKPPLPEEPGRNVDVETHLTDLAKADLAQRVDTSVEQIQTIEVQAVEWPDASLGCPQPGKMYAQVVTPGYQIILSVQGQEYEYHTNLGEVLLCKK